ncbi:MAG: VWA domain-containing protein, partial [Kiritimatiellia bacterium]
MNIQFVNGWVLLFAWVALGTAFLWLVLFKRRRSAIRAFLDEPMLSKLSPQARPARFYWQLVLFQAGLVMLIIAAARPQWGAEERKVFQRGRDLVIALDVSRSMLARDVHPSRLQRAKADVQDLLRELRGDRVALVAFRGHAIQLCPLTTDYAYLEQMLDAVTVDSAPPGETNIGAAIDKALAAFENDAGAHRAMVIISDGEDLAGQAMAAAGRAGEKGAVIFTVGLGDPKGANIPGLAKSEPVMTYQGQEVISRLQHETLKDIADTTGGAYVPVGVANVKLGKLYREHLSKIAAHDIEENIQRRMIERYQLFLFPGILALLAAVFLSRGRLATRRPAPDFAGRPLKTDIGRGPGASL